MTACEITSQFKIHKWKVISIHSDGKDDIAV